MEAALSQHRSIVSRGPPESESDWWPVTKLIANRLTERSDRNGRHRGWNRRFAPNRRRRSRFAVKRGAGVTRRSLRAVSVWQCEPSLLTDHDDRLRCPRQGSCSRGADGRSSGARHRARRSNVAGHRAARVRRRPGAGADRGVARSGHAGRWISWPRRHCWCAPGLGQPGLCVARTMPGHGRPLIPACGEDSKWSFVSDAAVACPTGLREVRTRTRRDAASDSASAPMADGAVCSRLGICRTSNLGRPEGADHAQAF